MTNFKVILDSIEDVSIVTDALNVRFTTELDRAARAWLSELAGCPELPGIDSTPSDPDAVLVEWVRRLDKIEKLQSRILGCQRAPASWAQQKIKERAHILLNTDPYWSAVPSSELPAAMRAVAAEDHGVA